MIHPTYFLKPYGFLLFLLDFENISNGGVLQCLLNYISAVDTLFLFIVRF